MKEKINCLITGGAGFIGSNLCNLLLSQNNHVVCLDNLSSGRKENISRFMENPDFEFVYQDISVPYEGSPDLIFNLACPASPKFYQKAPVETMKTNVLGAINVLNIAEKNNCPIFQASTSEVYGDPTEFPQKENYWGNVNPDGIRSCYDEGKRAAETIFMDYYRSHQTKIKIARIFNVYGPGMRSDDGRLISNLINQAIRNEPMTIYGDGMQTRSLCYIDDLLDGIIRLINTSDDVTGPVNLGNPDEKTVLEIASIIKEITGCKSEIKHCPLPKDDPKRRCPDITMAKKLLNWTPKVDLRTGIKKTLEYYSSLIRSRPMFIHCIYK